METLLPLDLPPGLAKNGTPYQNRNRWINGNLIRFYEGTIRPVGGWTLAVDVGGSAVQVTGMPRGSYAWRSNDGVAWLAVGTHTPKAYVFSASVLTDITPAGMTAGALDGSTVNGSLNYGAGNYGAFVYGGSSAAFTVDADTWSFDNFGEQLLGTFTADGKLYIWDKNIANDFVQVSGSPTGVKAVVVTPERFVFALGTSTDNRVVTWPSQETSTTWTPTSNNSAGDFTLQTNGKLMAGRRTDRETLLWTDTDVWSASYIGGTFIYRFDRRGDSCGLLGPNAVAIAGGSAFWMSAGQFYAYSGSVRKLPCDVADYVFSDLNQQQRAKIVAVPIVEFGEVWWFYPSASQSGLENDRYVSLNYQTGHWSTGMLARAAGVGAGVFENPEMWGTDSKLYTHEVGFNHDTGTPFLESGPLELPPGDRVVRIQRLIPDERSLGQVQATFFTAFLPMEAESSTGPYTLTASTDVRVTGRQVRVRLTEVTPADWRIGSMRLGFIPGGQR